KCGTLHTLSPDSNKDLYSKNIHNCTKQPDYPPRYTLKSIYRFFDGKTGATAFYKLHLAQRKVFQTACRVMNRGLYAQALDFFAIIPNFDGVKAKARECREAVYSKVFDSTIKHVEQEAQKFRNITPANLDHVTAAMMLELSEQKLPSGAEYIHEIKAVAAKKHKDFMKIYKPPKRKGDFAVILGALLQGLVMWIIFKILEALLS
ncbi:MAG: hypothetical protein IJU26_01500, partial [Synergistaceae bacterium]|nr:hypothetical protein [Synergistaceae bacterium]